MLDVKIDKKMGGLNRLGNSIGRYTHAGLKAYSGRLVGRARRNLGRVKTPRKFRLYGPRGRDMGLFGLKKRPKGKKTPAIWQQGSWIHKWIDYQDIRGRRAKNPLFHVGVRGGWKPAKILENGGSERVWGQVFYTQKPYKKKTKRKTKAAGTGVYTQRGKPKLITSHNKSPMFGRRPLRVTVKTPPFRLMMRSAKQTDKALQTEVVRSLRKGIRNSRR